MDQALRLLRAQCIYCHHFRMTRQEINRYHCKLRLIQHGLLSAADEVDNIDLVAKKAVATEAENASDDSDEEDGVNATIRQRLAFVKKAIKDAKEAPWEWNREKNEGVADARREVIKAFMKEISKKSRCATCKGISPSYRKDRFVKIFEKSLSAKDQAKMDMLNLKHVNAVQLVSGEKKLNSYGESDEAVDVEISSESEGEGESLDADGDVVMNGSSKTAAKTATSTVTKQMGKERYVNPMEVKAALQLLFEKEQEILSLVYVSRSTAKIGRAHV